MSSCSFPVMVGDHFFQNLVQVYFEIRFEGDKPGVQAKPRRIGGFIVIRQDEQQFLVIKILMELMQVFESFPGVGQENIDIQIPVTDRPSQVLSEDFQVRARQAWIGLETLINAALQALPGFIDLVVDVENKLYHGHIAVRKG